MKIFLFFLSVITILLSFAYWKAYDGVHEQGIVNVNGEWLQLQDASGKTVQPTYTGEMVKKNMLLSMGYGILQSLIASIAFFEYQKRRGKK